MSTLKRTQIQLEVNDMKATITTTDTEVTIAVNGQFVTLPIRNAVAMSNEILDQVRSMLPPAIPRPEPRWCGL